jgi:hypothetical protein
MRCEEVREALPAYARSGDVTLSVRRHLSSCSACSRELQRYEQVLEGLDGLRSRAVSPPVGLANALKAIPARENRLQVARTHVARHRKAYLGGLAVATAGAVGAAIWRSRVRAATA